MFRIRNYSRANTGEFKQKFRQPKHQRNVRLTDACWDGLKELAEQAGVDRPDLLEILGKQGGIEGIILSAIDDYINQCKINHENNPSKKGKEFSTATRDYTALIRFRESIERGEFIDPSTLMSDLLGG